MKPEIRYCTTGDGVRIAYTVSGDGPPLVFANDPTSSHVELEWEHPVLGPLMRRFANTNTLVRYDPRGSGLLDQSSSRFANPLAVWDASVAAAKIAAPTLILRHRDVQYVPEFATRELASLIPDCRLVVVDGRWADDPVGLASRETEFVNGRDQASAVVGVSDGMTHSSGMAVILFADIAESTALTERLGDAAFRERARGPDSRLRTIIGAHRGTAIDGKLLGDGVLATFAAASGAIEAALECAASSGNFELELHLGIHAGDVIHEANNVYGGAVNIASRIAGLSAPGELLVSDTVRSLARTSTRVRFDDRGEHLLKGIAEPQRVFVVRAN